MRDNPPSSASPYGTPRHLPKSSKIGRKGDHRGRGASRVPSPRIFVVSPLQGGRSRPSSLRGRLWSSPPRDNSRSSFSSGDIPALSPLPASTSYKTCVVGDNGYGRGDGGVEGCKKNDFSSEESGACGEERRDIVNDLQKNCSREKDPCAFVTAGVEGGGLSGGVSDADGKRRKHWSREKSGSPTSVAGRSHEFRNGRGGAGSEGGIRWTKENASCGPTAVEWGGGGEEAWAGGRSGGGVGVEGVRKRGIGGGGGDDARRWGEGDLVRKNLSGRSRSKRYRRATAVRGVAFFYLAMLAVLIFI